jgi:drug/metabolite transporter (DMT)-like permease
MDNRLKGYLLAIISSVAYGIIPLFMLPLKAIHLPVELILFYRFFISALFISGIVFYMKGTLKVTARELGILFILGMLFSVSSDCLFIGYDLLSPGIASTLLFVYPIWVALIMVGLYKEKISALTGLSLILTVCGIFILSMKGEGFSLNLAGLSVCLMCALLYAIYIVVINRAKLNISGMTVTFYSLLFSGA